MTCISRIAVEKCESTKLSSANEPETRCTYVHVNLHSVCSVQSWKLPRDFYSGKFCRRLI